MLTVLTSGKAAPGTTTSAWALAMGWPRALLVADCDLAGGDMVAGRLAGRVDTDAGLASWAAAARHSTRAAVAASQLLSHALQIPEHPMLALLPGLTTSAQGSSFTTGVWDRLAGALSQAPSALGRDVLVDTGRLVDERGCWPVVRSADQVLVVVRPSVRSVSAAQDAVRRLRHELGDLVRVSALVVGEGPYPAREVVEAIGLPLAGVLPHDPVIAQALADGAQTSDRALRRSPLARAASALASDLVTQAPAAGRAAAGVA